MMFDSEIIATKRDEEPIGTEEVERMYAEMCEFLVGSLETADTAQVNTNNSFVSEDDVVNKLTPSTQAIPGIVDKTVITGTPILKEKLSLYLIHVHMLSNPKMSVKEFCASFFPSGVGTLSRVIGQFAYDNKILKFKTLKKLTIEQAESGVKSWYTTYRGPLCSKKARDSKYTLFDIWQALQMGAVISMTYYLGLDPGYIEQKIQSALSITAKKLKKMPQEEFFQHYDEAYRNKTLQQIIEEAGPSTSNQVSSDVSGSAPEQIEELCLPQDILFQNPSEITADVLQTNNYSHFFSGSSAMNTAAPSTLVVPVSDVDLGILKKPIPKKKLSLYLIHQLALTNKEMTSDELCETFFTFKKQSLESLIGQFAYNNKILTFGNLKKLSIEELELGVTSFHVEYRGLFSAKRAKKEKIDEYTLSVIWQVLQMGTVQLASYYLGVNANHFKEQIETALSITADKLKAMLEDQFFQRYDAIYRNKTLQQIIKETKLGIADQASSNISVNVSEQAEQLYLSPGALALNASEITVDVLQANINTDFSFDSNAINAAASFALVVTETFDHEVATVAAIPHNDNENTAETYVNPITHQALNAPIQPTPQTHDRDNSYAFNIFNNYHKRVAEPLSRVNDEQKRNKSSGADYSPKL